MVSMLAVGRGNPGRNDERRTVPPLGNDPQDGLGNAAVRTGKVRVSGWLLIVCVTGVIPAEVVGDFLGPGPAVSLEVLDWYGPVLHGPGIDISDIARNVRAPPPTPGGFAYPMGPPG